MERLTLNGEWTLRVESNGSEWPAQVPGSVYADLLRNNAMDDPFWRDNELKALHLMDGDFSYSRCFTLYEEMLDADALILRCHGLDTLAELRLNGELLGRTDNMHRIWEFDITSHAMAGENTLVVRFGSPTRFIAKAYEEHPIDGSHHAMLGFPHLRKAHCMFGWDWGPRLPDAGIWRDIEVLSVKDARIGGIYITQRHEAGCVFVRADVEIEQFREDSKLEYQFELIGPDGQVLCASSEPDLITVNNPFLWWPRGYGSQPLYTARVLLLCNGKQIDSWERRIGLRTMTMSREKDQWGEEFAHKVNGVKIFAMGGDYIPEDNILSRVTPESTRHLLEQCVAANFNAVRVWGGGYYPDSFFYDICDELGLIVWQDLMFCCALYDLTSSFAANIRAELKDNIKRLRHHASLGLWCGNNEMEWQIAERVWKYTPSQYADYIRMYQHIFPEVLSECDPETFYWPASPSSGGGFDNPNDPNRGDVHYWDVWHGSKPFSEYRKFHFRYASEFGFQSFPSEKTIERFTLPEDRNPFSSVMERHQRNAAANGKIVNYLYQTYLYPRTLEGLVYSSQLLQAEAIRYGVEHWRRHRGRCMGAIYWQLNDCWPVASWASIDYFGRWKALHYYAKRFFAPVLLSCQEEGMMTQDPNLNAQAYPLKKKARLSVSNETMAQVKCLVEWSLNTPSGIALKEGHFDITVPALSAQWLEELDFPEADPFSNYFSYRLKIDGVEVSSGSVLFCPPKFFRFCDPALSINAAGDEIKVTALAYAKSVSISNKNDDLILEDNFFDMNPGTRILKVHSGALTDLKVRSVYNIE